MSINCNVVTKLPQSAINCKEQIIILKKNNRLTVRSDK